MQRRSFLQLLAAVPFIGKLCGPVGLWTKDCEFIINATSVQSEIALAACSDGNLRGWFNGERMAVQKTKFGCAFYQKCNQAAGEIDVRWDRSEPSVLYVNHVSIYEGKDYLRDDFRNRPFLVEGAIRL